MPYLSHKIVTQSCISLCILAIASSSLVVPSVVAQDLLPAIKLRTRSEKAATTTIVYYANETDPKSVTQLAEWLASEPDKAFQKAARNLRSDAKQFPSIVSKETAELVKGVSADKKLALVIFTNEDARHGRFRWLGAGSIKIEFVNWSPTKSKLKVFQRHPLAHPANFEKALQSVARVTDAAKTEFVLIAKSHGTPQLAVAQGFAPMYEASSSKALMAIMEQIRAAADKTRNSDGPVVKSDVQLQFEKQLTSEVSPSLAFFKAASFEMARELKEQKVGKSTLDPNADNTLDPNLDNTLDPNLDNTLDPNLENTLDPNLENTLGASNASKYFSEGISKQIFLETVIKMRAASDMYFETIFIESCKSELPRTSIKTLESLDQLNIGTLFVSDTAGLRYETIDYGDVFAKTGKQTFSDSLNSFMKQVQEKHAVEGLPKVDR